jgi:cyclophilin family peptidyl-prolyl cis-trans isomerase
MKASAKVALWFARLSSFAGLLLIATIATAQNAPAKVMFQTSMGSFVVEMDPQRAPKTVENFLRYVREGFYSGIIFHRVVPGFVVQAGGYDVQGNERDVHDPIALETATAADNARGTIAMARTNFPNSARSQFFINLQDNSQLDRAPNDPGNLTGYTVFGRVIDGMAVVDAIAMVQLGGTLGPIAEASPRTPVVIQRATIVN